MTLKKGKFKIKTNNLKEYLKEKGISQQELADELGITKSHMSHIVNNKKSGMTLAIALKISKVVKVPVEKLFQEA